MPRQTLKDVAKKAGVSVAAASLALRGKGRISEEVRARVRSAAEALSYRSAGSSRGRSATRPCIGIVHVEDRAYEWHFVRPTIIELERAILDRGLNPVILPVRARTHGSAIVRLAVDAGVSAVFTLQPADGDALAELQERGIIVVVLNTSGFQDRFPSVCVDDFQGAYEGTRHLLDLGHRSIAFVEYDRPENPEVVADRFVGFRKALEERGASFPAEHRVTIPFLDTVRLRRRLEALFSRRRSPRRSSRTTTTSGSTSWRRSRRSAWRCPATCPWSRRATWWTTRCRAYRRSPPCASTPRSWDASGRT